MKKIHDASLKCFWQLTRNLCRAEKGQERTICKTKSKAADTDTKFWIWSVFFSYHSRQLKKNLLIVIPVMIAAENRMWKKSYLNPKTNFSPHRSITNFKILTKRQGKTEGAIKTPSLRALKRAPTWTLCRTISKPIEMIFFSAPFSATTYDKSFRNIELVWRLITRLTVTKLG